jgi:putative spermidine/putrescine transport system permease protein
LRHYGRCSEIPTAGGPAQQPGHRDDATLVTLAAGAAFAIGAWRLAGRTTTLLYLMLLAPMILPPIVYAVGLFRLWAELKMLDTFVGTAIAHTVLATPFVVVTVGASLAAHDPR